MRWHKNRQLGILVISVITLFLVAACQGSDGDTGLSGLKGDPGVPGAAGSAGDVGSEGEKGDAGPRGGAGSQGSEGPEGDSAEATTAAIVLVPNSVSTKRSWANTNPAFGVWGSGFTTGDSYNVQIWDAGTPTDLIHASSEAVTVSGDGAIGGSWSTAVSAGLYTVAVTDASGVMATAPLVVERAD